MGYNSAVKYTIAVQLIFWQQKNFEFDIQVWGVRFILRCDIYSGKCSTYTVNPIIIESLLFRDFGCIRKIPAFKYSDHIPSHSDRTRIRINDVPLISRFVLYTKFAIIKGPL